MRSSKQLLTFSLEKLSPTTLFSKTDAARICSVWRVSALQSLTVTWNKTRMLATKELLVSGEAVLQCNAKLLFRQAYVYMNHYR